MRGDSGESFLHAKALQVIDPVRLVVCLGPSKSSSESWDLTARIKAVLRDAGPKASIRESSHGDA